MSIVLDGLRKRYGHHLVVDRLSLKVEEGELFVLLGASGSGKSTVLRMIAGLTEPNEGRIFLDGREVTDSSPQDRGVGFVFQNYSVFGHMTAAENVAFALRIRKAPADLLSRRTEELLDLVGLSGLGNRLPAQLSGGQQQRVALARALAHKPRVLLLDEPFGALDVKIRVHLRRVLRDIQRTLGVTTILVTHDQDEAFELADRIGVMEKGRLLEVGTPESLYKRPLSLYTAAFIGEGTILAGRVQAGVGRFGPLCFPVPGDFSHEQERPVHVLVRPEHVLLGSEPPLPGESTLGKGTIHERTFSGSTNRLRILVPRGPGARQMSPVPSFGQEDWIIEAEESASEPTGTGEVWIRLRHWHLLEQEQPHVLVFDNEASEGLAHFQMAAWLSESLDGLVQVLRTRKEDENAEQVGKLLEKRMRAAGLESSAPFVPTGRSAEQIIREQLSGAYDLIVLSKVQKPRGMSKMLTGLLSHVEVPTLVLPGDFQPLRRMLICTAAGQPGQHDVEVGGWLARRLDLTVRVLHVLTPGRDETNARSHLERALRNLHSRDIRADYSLRVADQAKEAILAEATEGKHDVIVIGGHGPHARSLFGPHDIAAEVLSEAVIPVLVVPATGTD